MGSEMCIRDRDNGRSLSLIPGVDSFRKLTQQEIAQEQDVRMEEMKL